MLYKKFIYTFLAVLLLAGLSGAFVLYRMLAPGGGPDLEISEAGSGEPAPAAKAPKPSPSVPIKDEKEKEEEKSSSLVGNLLKNPGARQQFGAFRLKSIVADDAAPKSGRATIEDMDTGSTRTYYIDDTLPDNSRLVAVKQDYVVLQKAGVRKRIFFNFGGEDRGDAKLPGADGYSQINNNEFNLNPYRVFKGDADQVLDFSMKIHSSNGDMDGIQITDVRSGTLADLLGLKEGDVLLAVNNQPVDSVLNAVRACMNAHGSDDVQLKVRRSGRVTTLTYHLFWQGQGNWTSSDVLRSKAVSSLLNEAVLSHLF
jgi:type II secretory pathway component PulC